MPTFSGGNAAFTPSTTNDNWTLDFAATAHSFGKVVAFGWGGSLTTSTGYRTRWTRPTAAGTGTRTALTLAYNQPFYTAAGATLVSTYATTQPTLAADPSGNLHRQDWNAQGGLGYIALPLANPWWGQADTLVGAISCRNTLGTDANGSSYHVSWEE
jgi:YD repeat-containing protein